MKIKPIVLGAVLMGLAGVSNAASLRVQRAGSSASSMKTWESSWSSSYDAKVEQALRYTITLSGDSDECEQLCLEVYYYGQSLSGSEKLPVEAVAQESFSVPACSKRKTIVLVQSPVTSIRKEKTYTSVVRKYGVKITGILVKLLRGKKVLKAYTDVAGLGGKKLFTITPKVDIEADFSKPSEHVIKAEWQEEMAKKPAKKGDKEETPVVANEEKGFAFMGVVFGNVYEPGSWTPPRRFGKFDTYQKYVTPKTKKLYKLYMYYYNWADNKNDLEAEYREIIEALGKKYDKVPATTTSGGYSRSRSGGYSRSSRSVFSLGDIEIVVGKGSSRVELTVEDRKLRELNEKEQKEQDEEEKKKDEDRLDIDVL